MPGLLENARAARADSGSSRLNAVRSGEGTMGTIPKNHIIGDIPMISPACPLI